MLAGIIFTEFSPNVYSFGWARSRTLLQTLSESGTRVRPECHTRCGGCHWLRYRSLSPRYACTLVWPKPCYVHVFYTFPSAETSTLRLISMQLSSCKMISVCKQPRDRRAFVDAICCASEGCKERQPIPTIEGFGGALIPGHSIIPHSSNIRDHDIRSHI